jgi:hypothetical protein
MKAFSRIFSIQTYSHFIAAKGVYQKSAATILQIVSSPILPFLLAICLAREYMCMRSMRNI